MFVSGGSTFPLFAELRDDLFLANGNVVKLKMELPLLVCWNFAQEPSHKNHCSSS